MSALQEILTKFRDDAKTEREKGTYFEELTRTYFRNEPIYKDLYSDVWLFGDWAKEHDYDARDVGIDLVAKTHDTEEFHAIQCKFYDDSYHVQKKDIDSFFTASGQEPFKHRYIVTTTNNWSDNAEAALFNQQPPVTKIGLLELEASQIDWAKYKPNKAAVLKEQKSLRPHQDTALKQVVTGLKEADRGKLIMACGTGKTFTSLKISEKIAGKGKRVLFLVPSLALMSQTLTEWSQESKTPLHAFAVCSDSEVGKRRKSNDDIVQTFAHELQYPATTNPQRLAEEVTKRHDSKHMSVVFSTYHSINVISEAQYGYNLDEFDLIICDEAHRTTGATFGDETESNFVKVHDAEFIKAAKRLYMTATPRIYSDSAQATAEQDNVALCSMDDESLYGKELHVLSFSESVKRDLLVDYKVIVLTVDEAHVNARLQNLLKDANNQLRVDDAAKIVGAWKALSKQGTEEDLGDDADPMQKAIAFCQVIEPSKGKAKHKVSSKNIASMFQAVIEAYKEQDETDTTLICEAEHVDGSMNAGEKGEKLAWLKKDTGEDTCRILSNVRCLSEGVDVPALDAVLFLTPRNSQVDVVQSVGRVMRKDPKNDDKKRGYVILPVVIPAGMEPHEALNDNQVYKVVWEVLQALRSHDDRFDAMINKLDLIGKDISKMEVIAITDKLQKKAKKDSTKKTGKGSHNIGEPEEPDYPTEQVPIEFEISEIERALYAKVVKKCGNRNHWEEWANDIAKIARTHISRIQAILDEPFNKKEIKAFNEFAHELRDDLNDAITDPEIVEMLAQHLITKPVFDALFSDYSFAAHNPISLAMQDLLDILQEHRLEKEADTLDRFYESVKLRAEGIDNAEGKQKIVVELYDKFFRNAFPKMTERLGIVYTPVEVVDFIIHSVNHILETEFDQTLGSKGVHIIDPFTGTGTFITRLLQGGLITPKQLPNKYRHEIHANEIVLLAYYIAAINIEAAYHDIVGGEYAPFEGICLTDTFQLYEKEDLVDELLVKNSARRKRQKSLDIKVIMANPPYSAGQSSANDNNQNVDYPHLDGRIRDTYAAGSTATLKNALYDSYIRSIRWASDRVGESGVIGFVTNAGFLDANTADGMRKCLVGEFSNIYVFHLRGNQRTQGELSRKEGGKIFGSGSRAPIAISLLVKNPLAQHHGQIYFHDIGDYLKREEKLEKISAFGSIAEITAQNGWRSITPDQHGDWLNLREEGFNQHIPLGDKKVQNEQAIFQIYSGGLMTSRDAWCYNASRDNVAANIATMVQNYTCEVSRYVEYCDATVEEKRTPPKDFVNNDPTKISWTVNLLKDLERNHQISFHPDYFLKSLYRPYTKQWLYRDRNLNERPGQMFKLFPAEDSKNILICVSGIGTKSGFTTLITDLVPSRDNIEKGQCFPLYVYESIDEKQRLTNASAPSYDLFSEDKDNARSSVSGFRKKEAISDNNLKLFQDSYPSKKVNKEDIFYYIYGLLHSSDYRERYATNLRKELPRIPCAKTDAGFWSFSNAGRELAELHLNYESVDMYPVTINTTGSGNLTKADYRVEKMKYGKNGKERDLTTLIYNNRITLTGIPSEAYEYVVNGKPALDWVVERQCVKTDKKSGIVNDANDWAIETMNNPKYPLELFQRVITVSLETMKIVKNLPKLGID